MRGTAARLLAGFNFGTSLLILSCTPISYTDEIESRDILNLTAIYSSRSQLSLSDLTGFWQFNESIDLSKYEDFDHAKFMDVPGIKFESALDGEEGQKRSTGALDDVVASSTQDVPTFDSTLVTNVSVQLGGTAFLHCRVRNANDLMVSWIRREDWHIISSGTLIYTNDERFHVVHSDDNELWDLHIRYVKRRDNGTYECQVATSSGVVSHFYNLHVVVASAFILGSQDFHVKEGSTISLVCIMDSIQTPPQYVFWYHNNRLVNYDTVKPGVTITTEPGPRTHSRLLVSSAAVADSGNYSCRAPNTVPHTVHVFVSKEGESTAAIQRQNSALMTSLSPPGYVILVTLALLTYS